MKEKIKKLFMEAKNAKYDFVKMVKPIKDLRKIKKEIGEEEFCKWSLEVCDVPGVVHCQIVDLLVVTWHLDEIKEKLKEFPQNKRYKKLLKNYSGYEKAKQMLKEENK